MMSLAGHAEANAFCARFRQADPATTWKWFHEAARLDQLGHQMTPDIFGPGAKALQLLKPVVSNDGAPISCFVNCEAMYDARRVQDHRPMTSGPTRPHRHCARIGSDGIALRASERRSAERCIGTPGTCRTDAKLARRRGCRVELTSPLVSVAWLALDPPERFEWRYET